MGNKYLYIPTNWQGFIQQLEFLINRSGYRYFHVTYYPDSKKHKWQEIDQKLINKYQTDMTRSERYRNKQKDNANFWFLRYDNCAVLLMATKNFKGKDTQTKHDITIDDEFFDIQKKDMNIKIGQETGFKFHSRNKKIIVSMTAQMFKDVKAKLLDVSKTKNVKKAKYEFQKLNGLPAWSGINEQKFQLLDVLVEELKRHNVKVNKSYFFVKLTRDKVKVFD